MVTKNDLMTYILTVGPDCLTYAIWSFGSWDWEPQWSPQCRPLDILDGHINRTFKQYIFHCASQEDRGSQYFQHEEYSFIHEIVHFPLKTQDKKHKQDSWWKNLESVRYEGINKEPSVEITSIYWWVHFFSGSLGLHVIVRLNHPDGILQTVVRSKKLWTFLRGCWVPEKLRLLAQAWSCEADTCRGNKWGSQAWTGWDTSVRRRKCLQPNGKCWRADQACWGGYRIGNWGGVCNQGYAEQGLILSFITRGQVFWQTEPAPPGPAHPYLPLQRGSLH